MLLQPVFKSKGALPAGRISGLRERGCHKAIKPFLYDWQIVISSGWKLYYSLEQLRTFFSQDVAKSIIDVTYTIGKGDIKYRGQEIEYYVAINNVDKYIIIDDSAEYLLPHQKQFAVVTNPETGFTAKDAGKLRKLINQL